MERDGKNGDEVGREPVGLTKGRKNAVLDILDPHIFVDTEMFEDSVSSDEKWGAHNRVEKEREFFMGDVGNYSVKENDVADSWSEATMEAGIVAVDASMRVNWKDGRNYLRD